MTNTGREQPDSPQIYTVSQLTAAIKFVLEDTFPEVWVTGEVSNLSRPRSGHCYLSLKDSTAQLPAVIWRSTASRLRFELSDGLAVVCRGRLNVYPPHGKYQLVIDRIMPEGLGTLELAFRQLREKLAKAGLFDTERKRPLPFFPRRVAVITSPTGAAVRDFLQVLRRRRPDLHVIVFPVRVQGDEAAGEIARAIEVANRCTVPLDVLVVTRGGGSLEDLWAFNEEIVCRAIAASRIPVVSAIGHEIDITLSDLTADLRALTPTEAAERISPGLEEVEGQLLRLEQRLAGALLNCHTAAAARVDGLAARSVFARPLELVERPRQQLDDLDIRLQRAMEQLRERRLAALGAVAGRLEALSPLAVLRRGYSITEPSGGGRPVTHAEQLQVGDFIRTRFARGSATSRVEHLDMSQDK